ncbi:hypothetical protein [Brasilonema sp. UFV-L1]|uniref:hypothetical protein n=1 Tax=Brasilonema sp. UFV-L1 TaxID=2234130 RepID=UPI00145F578C|nr:hypothetical protein [Brasilonema sp. UFV-L1]NMG06807.1 hypothetical protein [Brasilonema sp. UFV-L1]
MSIFLVNTEFLPTWQKHQRDNYLQSVAFTRTNGSVGTVQLTFTKVMRFWNLHQLALSPHSTPPDSGKMIPDFG